MPPILEMESQHQVGVMDNWAVNKSILVTFQVLGKNKTYRALLGNNNPADYDSEGAVIYVLAVILIYGISIVMLILATVRGRDYHQHLDKQVQSYLRNAESIRQRGQTETILKPLKRHCDIRLDYTSTLPGFQLDCQLPLISESGEPNDHEEGTESDTGAYYSNITPMATPRMERRRSRSESNVNDLANLQALAEHYDDKVG